MRRAAQSLRREVVSLRVPLPSQSYEGYVYEAGTKVVTLERLGRPHEHVWLVELAHPNASLVGGFEFEVLSVPRSDLSFLEDETCG
jgi:hypothetical protein